MGMSLFDGFNRKREQRNARIQIENQQLRIQELEVAHVRTQGKFQFLDAQLLDGL